MVGYRVRAGRVLLLGLAALSWGCGRSLPADPPADLAIVEAIRSGDAGAAGAATTQQPTGTGWGTLRGVFHYNGAVPAVGTLKAGGQDAAVCGQTVTDESLLVDPDTKGIRGVVVYARNARRVFEGESAAPAEPMVFDQKKCAFLSHVAGIQVGQTLLIKNSDPMSHNTNLSPPGNQPSNNLLSPGGEAPYEFTRALSSPAPVTCNIHPWMKAYLIARDDPYFAITAVDGSFEIPNLPAGEEIEFQVWHERASGGLEAKPDWSRGRFTLIVPADGVEDLQTIDVPASAFQ